jgi:hypothetical protein
MIATTTLVLAGTALASFSGLISALSSHYITKKRANSEVESVIINNYKQILDEYRNEHIRSKEEASNREKYYLDQISTMLNEKKLFSEKIHTLEAQNIKLLMEITELKERLSKYELCMLKNDMKNS